MIMRGNTCFIESYGLMWISRVSSRSVMCSVCSLSGSGGRTEPEEERTGAFLQDEWRIPVSERRLTKQSHEVPPVHRLVQHMSSWFDWGARHFSGAWSDWSVSAQESVNGLKQRRLFTAQSPETAFRSHFIHLIAGDGDERTLMDSFKRCWMRNEALNCTTRTALTDQLALVYLNLVCIAKYIVQTLHILLFLFFLGSVNICINIYIKLQHSPFLL